MLKKRLILSRQVILPQTPPLSPKAPKEYLRFKWVFDKITRSDVNNVFPSETLWASIAVWGRNGRPQLSTFAMFFYFVPPISKVAKGAPWKWPCVIQIVLEFCMVKCQFWYKIRYGPVKTTPHFPKYTFSFYRVIKKCSTKMLVCLSSVNLLYLLLRIRGACKLYISYGNTLLCLSAIQIWDILLPISFTLVFRRPWPFIPIYLFIFSLILRSDRCISFCFVLRILWFNLVRMLIILIPQLWDSLIYALFLLFFLFSFLWFAYDFDSSTQKCTERKLLCILW